MHSIKNWHNYETQEISFTCGCGRTEVASEHTYYKGRKKTGDALCSACRAPLISEQCKRTGAHGGAPRKYVPGSLLRDGRVVVEHLGSPYVLAGCKCGHIEKVRADSVYSCTACRKRGNADAVLEAACTPHGVTVLERRERMARLRCVCEKVFSLALVPRSGRFRNAKHVVACRECQRMRIREANRNLWPRWVDPAQDREPPG